MYKVKYLDIQRACAVGANGEFKTVGSAILNCKGFNRVLLEERSDLTRGLGFPMEDGVVDLSRVTLT